MLSATPNRSRRAITLCLSLVNGIATLSYYVIVVRRYGVTASTDLVFAVGLLPNVLYTVSFGQLNEILVPYFVRRLPAQAATAFWNVMSFCVVVGAAFGLLLVPVIKYVSPVVYGRVAVGLEPGLVMKLAVLAVLYNLAFSLLIIKTSYLIAIGRPGLTQVLMAAGNVLASIWIFHKGQANQPLQIITAQVVGVMLSLLVPVFRSGFLFYRIGSFSCDVQEAVARVRWLVVNAAVSKTEPLFDIIIAGFLGPGAVTIFYLFQRIINFAHSTVQNGFVLPFAKQASEIREKGLDGLSRAVHRAALESTAVTAVILFASGIGLFGFGLTNIPALMLYAHVFESNIGTFILLLGYGIFTLAAKSYTVGLYVLLKEKTYTYVSAAVFVFAMLVKIGGSYLFGLHGLALGESCGYALLLVAVRQAFVRAICNTTDGVGSYGSPQPELVVE